MFIADGFIVNVNIPFWCLRHIGNVAVVTGNIEKVELISTFPAVTALFRCRRHIYFLYGNTLPAMSAMSAISAMSAMSAMSVMPFCYSQSYDFAQPMKSHIWHLLTGLVTDLSYGNMCLRCLRCLHRRCSAGNLPIVTAKWKQNL